MTFVIFMRSPRRARTSVRLSAALMAATSLVNFSMMFRPLGADRGKGAFRATQRPNGRKRNCGTAIKLNGLVYSCGSGYRQAILMRYKRGMKWILTLALLIGLMPALGAAAEQLQVPELPGWKNIDAVDGPGVETSSLIPSEETQDGWTRRLTVQAFTTTQMTAAGFLDGMANQIGAACEGFNAGPILSSPVSGHEAGRRVIACGRFKGDDLGSYSLYLAVRGRQALYVLARSWRGQPYDVGRDPPVAPSELARWSASFDKVRLCDEAPCR